jgi:hypothetical protein
MTNVVSFRNFYFQQIKLKKCIDSIRQKNKKKYNDEFKYY